MLYLSNFWIVWIMCLGSLQDSIRFALSSLSWEKKNLIADWQNGVSQQDKASNREIQPPPCHFTRFRLRTAKTNRNPWKQTLNHQCPAPGLTTDFVCTEPNIILNVLFKIFDALWKKYTHVWNTAFSSTVEWKKIHRCTYRLLTASHPKLNHSCLRKTSHSFSLTNITEVSEWYIPWRRHTSYFSTKHILIWRAWEDICLC